MKYFVRVCRPRFEVAAFEIEAEHARGAENFALRASQTLPADMWNCHPWDAESYSPHVEWCRSLEDLTVDDDGKRLEARIDEASSSQPDEFTRYLLLSADTSIGEGKLVLQPWLVGAHQVLQIDLAIDWKSELQPIREHGVAAHIAKRFPFR